MLSEPLAPRATRSPLASSTPTGRPFHLEACDGLLVSRRLPPSGALMSNIYLKHKDEDGFLYICYSGENSFG